MLFSIGCMLLLGLLLGECCKRVKLPGLLGMLLTGILLGPYVLNWIDSSILGISGELRKIALLIILMRAGLTLDIKDLKKVGRPAVLMCFVPACFEILGMVFLAPKILGVTVLEAAIMGAVVGAVSPAVIVPKMIQLIKEGYGTKKSIPQLILAGALVDDVFVIVVFSAFTGAAKGGSLSFGSLAKTPISIILGGLVGLVIGYGIITYFQKFHVRDTVKIIILVSISFMLVTFEDVFGNVFPFSGLIAIICLGVGFKIKGESVAIRLSNKLNKMWIVAEIMLFVLVGATVDLKYAAMSGISALLLIVMVLLFRMLGVLCCLVGTKLNFKERIFCVIAYMPKATVQAAIGGIPLAMGLGCGSIVLTVAVLAILITAPLGAFLIDFSHKKLLEKEG